MDIFRNLSQSAQEALFNSINANVSASGTYVDTAGDTLTGQLNADAGLRVGSSGNALSQVLVSGATLSPAPVGPNTAVEQTFTVPSPISLTDAIFAVKPSGQTGLSIGGVRVSAASTLAIHFVNSSAATLSPNVEFYRWATFR